MAPTPKLRWLRFSLRTLFVVVTVLACWLGYYVNWHAQRNAVLGSDRILSHSFRMMSGSRCRGRLRFLVPMK